MVGSGSVVDVADMDLEFGYHHSHRIREEMIFRYHLYMWTAIILAALQLYFGQQDFVFHLIVLGWVVFVNIPDEPVEKTDEAF